MSDEIKPRYMSLTCFVFKYEQVREQIGKKNLAKKEVETFIILW